MDRSEIAKDAFFDGRDAYCDGRSDNPFPSGTLEAREFRKGWLDTRARMEGS